MPSPSENNRSRLISTAWDLFAERGYRQTAIQHIIDQVGVAKGTFYHYFKSKDELLDAVIEWISKQAMSEMRSVIDDPTLGALGKLYHFMENGSAWKVKNRRLIKWLVQAIHKEDNFVLRHRITKMSNRLTKPTITQIFREGMEEGVFKIEHPEETAELFLQFGYGFLESIGPWIRKLDTDPEAIEHLRVYYGLYFTFIERLLGIPHEMLQTSNNVMEALFGEDA